MGALALKNKVGKLSTSSKFIGIGAIAILILSLFSYYKGKASGTTNIDFAPLPKNNQVLNEDEAKRIRVYTRKIHEDLTEIFGLRDHNLYEQMNSERDHVIVSIYNDFNDLYGKEEKGTLTQWIIDEVAPSLAMDIFQNRLLALNLG